MGMVVLPKRCIFVQLCTLYMHVWCCDGVDGQMGMVAPLLGFPHLGFNTSVSSGAAKFELQTTLITLI